MDTCQTEPRPFAGVFLRRALKNTRDFAERSLWNIGPLALIRLDVGIPDHLAPLLGVVDDELAKFGRRGGIRLQAQIDEPRLELRAGKRLIDELIEGGDNLR